MKTIHTDFPRLFLSNKAFWHTLVCTAILALPGSSFAATIAGTGWKGTAASPNQGNWSNSGNWDSTGPGSDERNLFFGNGYVTAGNTGSKLSTNDISGYNGYRITFENNASLSGGFTIKGNGFTLYDFGSGLYPRIENDSAFTQTFTLTSGQTVGLQGNQTAGQQFAEIDPVTADITFSAGTKIDLVGTTQLRVYGNNRTLTFNDVISSSGNSGNNSVSFNQTNTVIYGAANTYAGDTFVNAGKLQFAAGGSANSSSIRIGDTAGAAAAEVDLTPAAGGLTLSSVFNARSGSAGTATIASQNTSGANTLSGHIALDKALTITQTGGGTLNITQAKGGDTTTATDIKAQSLTLTPAASGTIDISGDIYNSSGNGTVTHNGAGTVIIRGSANSYSGLTTMNNTAGALTMAGTKSSAGGVSLLEGALNVNSANGLGTGTLTIGNSALTCTLNNTSGSAVVNAGNNTISFGFSTGGVLNIGTAGSTSANNLDLGTGTASTSGNRTFAFQGTGQTLTLGTYQNQNTATSRTTTINGPGNTLALRGFNISTAGTGPCTMTLAGTANLTISGSVANGNANANLLTDTMTGTVTLSGNNTFTGLLTHNAASGILTLSGDNSAASGGVNLSAGTLNINSTTALGTGTFTIGGNGFVDNTSGSAKTLGNNAVTISGGSPTFFTNAVDATHDLTFGSGTVTISGANRTITVSNATSTLTFGGGVTDAGGAKSLTKAGPGTLVLNGAAGTWTGGAVITAGTLSIGSDTALGTGSVSLNGGTLQSSGGARALANNFTFDADPSAIAGSAAITINGTFSNSGANRTLNVNNSALTTFAGNVFLDTANTSVRKLTIAGTGNLTISGNIANNSAGNTLANKFTCASSGIVILSGNNTYDGLTEITSGTLTLSGNNSGADGGVTLTAGALNVNNANALGAASGTFTWTTDTTLNNTSGGAIVNAANNPVTLANIGTVYTFGTSASTSVNNLDLGTGVVTANSSRTFNIPATGGGVTLTMGKLNNTSATTGRTFTFNGANNNYVLRGFGLANAPSATICTLAGTANLTINDTISNGDSNQANTNAVTGTGLTIFSGNNNYTGPTTIASGATLKLGNANALGTTAAGTTVSSGGVMDLNGQTIGAETLGLSGTGVNGAALTNSSASPASLSGAVTLNGDSTIGVITNSSITLSGGVNESGSRQLTKAGDGTLILSGASSYSGVTKISAGTLQVNGPSALASGSTLNSGGSTSDTTLLNLATADSGYAMAAISIGGIMRITNGAASGTSTLTFAGSAAQGFTGNAATKKISVADKVNVVVNGSDFQLLGAGVTVDRNHNIQVDGTGTLTFNNTVVASGSAFNAGFNKLGTGLLTLAAPSGNTYNGNTTNNAGTLVVANTSGSGTGTGSLTVNTNATFGGSGIISGALTVNAGGIVAPGVVAASAGATLTLAGTVTLNSASIVSNRINKAAGPVLTADKVNKSGGTLTLAGTLKVVLDGGTLALGDSFDLFDGTLAGSFAATNLPALATGLKWDCSQLATGGNGTITVTCDGTLAADAAANTTICSGESYALNGSATGGSGGYAYSWTNAAVSSGFNSASANPSVSPTSTTTYTLTVTDSVGCTATKLVTVTVNPTPVSTITVDSTTCSGSTGNSASVPAQAGVSYTWTIGNGTITAGSGTGTITYTAGSSGSVSLTCGVTNTTTSCGSSSSGSVTINPSVTVAGTITLGAQSRVPQTLLIIGGKFAPTGGAGLTVSAVTQGTNSGVISTDGNSVTYSNSAIGLDSFTYTVTNSTGCSATGTINVTVSGVTNQQTAQLSFNGSGNAVLVFWGVPGTTYTIQKSADLSTWANLSPTVMANDTNTQPYGRIEYTDTGTANDTAGYYRLKP